MFHPFEVDEGMLVRVLLEDLIEERTAGTDDHLVTFDLFIILTGQGHITELRAVVLPFEGLTGALVKLFPDQFVALRCHAVL